MKKDKVFGRLFSVSLPRSIPKILLQALPALAIEAVFILSKTQGQSKLPYTYIIHALAFLTLIFAEFKPRIPWFTRWIPFLLTPLFGFGLLECLSHNPLDMKENIIWFNIIFFILATLILLFATGRTAPTYIIVIAVPMIFGLISYFTAKFRGTPLLPWDLASYGIAATVLGGYEINITAEIATIFSVAVFTGTVAVVWNARIKFKYSWIVRTVCTVLSCIMMYNAVSFVQTDEAIKKYGLYPYLFTPDYLYYYNGFTVSFLMNLRYATVEKPSGYDADDVAADAAKYQSDAADDAKVKPNVIVIMNESFAEMKYLCDYETTEPYMEFIDSLRDSDEAYVGNLHVSVVGGNTPNSEFEFLTGMSMGYLPYGSIAYQQFIKSECPTIATQMSELGYRTIAMHPYWASGWKRDVIYPLFGFDETYFLDDYFRDEWFTRSYVSDKGLFHAIEKKYDEKDEDEPLFVFAVTMQNHSGYSKNDYGNFTPQINVKGHEGNISLRMYMSLIRETDIAFRMIVNYFKAKDEPTVILMFGDHQPNDSVAVPLMNSAGFVYDDSDVVSSSKRFVVPYVFWTNMDTEVEVPENVSINQLPSILMEIAGLPKTALQKFETEMRDEYPVITSRYFMDTDGNIEKVSDYEKAEVLKRYADFQYNYLFDKDNIPTEFYTLK